MEKVENITVELDVVQVTCLAQFCFFCGNGFNFRKLSDSAVLLYSPLHASRIIKEMSFRFSSHATVFPSPWKKISGFYREV